MKPRNAQTDLNTIINFTLRHQKITLILVVHAHQKVSVHLLPFLFSHTTQVIFFQTGLYTEIERASHFLCTTSVNSFKFIKRISTEFDLPNWREVFTSLWHNEEHNPYAITYINTGIIFIVTDCFSPSSF